jgi:hypothetical protein
MMMAANGNLRVTGRLLRRRRRGRMEADAGVPMFD